MPLRKEDPSNTTYFGKWGTVPSCSRADSLLAGADLKVYNIPIAVLSPSAYPG